MLHTLAMAGDSNAVEGFENKAFEKSPVQLVSFCAEPMRVQFAEYLANHCRQEHERLSSEMYSALMRVYSQARFLHKTKLCRLYVRGLCWKVQTATTLMERGS